MPRTRYTIVENVALDCEYRGEPLRQQIQNNLLVQLSYGRVRERAGSHTNFGSVVQELFSRGHSIQVPSIYPNPFLFLGLFDAYDSKLWPHATHALNHNLPIVT